MYLTCCTVLECDQQAMFASTARTAQERNLLNNMRLEDEGRKELDSEFILPQPKRSVIVDAVLRIRFKIY